MSIKLIQISDIPEGPLTVDSTLITVDSTLYTADQTITNSTNTHSLTIIPRFYSDFVDMKFWNELTEVETTLTNIATTELEGYLTVSFVLEVSNSQNYEVTINDTTGKLMWRGKVYVTDQTDIQNFTMYPKDSNNIIKF